MKQKSVSQHLSISLGQGLEDVLYTLCCLARHERRVCITRALPPCFDQGFQWMLRRLLNVIPDVDRFTWSNYVAEGFNVPGADILLNTLILAGYLLPWAVLAYYLFKSREVATW